MNRYKKVELNLNIDFGSLVLFRILFRRGKVLESSVQFHDQEGGTEIIPSRLLIPFRLEKSAYKKRKNIFTSHFLSRPSSHLNSP